MNVTSKVRTTPAQGGVYWLTPLRVKIYCALAIFISLGWLIKLGIHYYVLHDAPMLFFASDFAVFWSAARVAFEHGGAAVFSPDLMHTVEMSVRSHDDYSPWPYPPTFLLVIFPLGFLPFNLALTAFFTFSAAAYVAFIRRIAEPFDAIAFLPIVAFPGLFFVVLYGQNSLITAAFCAAALMFLPHRPVLAGAFIALLGIKPQLGILVPLFLICGRHWRALASAVAFSLLFWGGAILAFGTETLFAFYRAASAFHDAWVAGNANMWPLMPTVYGVLRICGVSSVTAYALHVMAALFVVGGVTWFWSRPARYTLKAAAFVCGTLFIQPYMGFYDLAWLAIVIAFLAVDMREHGARPAEHTLLVVTWLMPLQAFAALRFPAVLQWTPAVLILLLAIILGRHLRAAGQTSVARR